MLMTNSRSISTLLFGVQAVAADPVPGLPCLGASIGGKTEGAAGGRGRDGESV